MVGDQQPLRGDEPRRAAVELHGRVEQARALLRPERPGRDLEAQLAKPLRIVLQHLLGGPLSFHGECSCAGGPEAEDGYDGGTEFHGAAVYRRAGVAPAKTSARILGGRSRWGPSRAALRL